MPIAKSIERHPAKRGQRVLFPLWAKLGLLFGGLVGAFIALYGWLGFQKDLEREKEAHKQMLVGLAASLARAIDGDVHATFQHEDDSLRPEFVALQQWLRRAIDENHLRWAGTLVRDERGRFTHVIAAEEIDPLPIGYPMFDGTVAANAAYKREPTFEPNMEDEWGRYWSAFGPIYNHDQQVVGLLELDFDADIEQLLRTERTRRLTWEIVLGVVLAMGSAVAFARYLNRHLRTLTASALCVASGDLERKVDIRSRDEIGVLGQAFNSMVAGLRDREFIRDTFGRYLTEEVAAKVLSDPGSLKLGGELKRVTVLISDLRGFTGLAETLEPEVLLGLLNRYFSSMADVVMHYGGIINELMGDGMLVLFGAPTGRADDALRAAACAIAMQRALESFNRAAGRALEMGIALNTGEVVAGNIGCERRMKYGVLGDPINLAARLENFTVGNQVLISAATFAAVREHVAVGPPMDVRVKGKSEPVRCYPLLHIGAPHDLSMPETAATDDGVAVQLPAQCSLIRGKQIDAQALPAVVIRLSRHRATLQTDWLPELLDNLRMRIEDPQAGRILENLYGKITEIESPPDSQNRILVRFTSLPDDARAWLADLPHGKPATGDETIGAP